MGNLSISTQLDNKSRKEVLFSDDADEEKQPSHTTHVSVDILAEDHQSMMIVDSRCRVLHRVPPQVCERKKHIYDPVVLSLGPYHHGKPRFQQVEKLKDEVLGMMLDSKDKDLYLSKIRERIFEIRDFYGGLSINEYDNETLSEMMLRDGCFVLYYMEICSGDEEKDNHIVRSLGLSRVAFMFRDFFMLENQIPLWVVKLFIGSIYNEEDQCEAFLYKFLSEMNFGDDRLTRIPWEEQEPLHLLEAHRTTLIKGESISTTIEVPSMSHRRTFRFRWGRKKAYQSSLFETVNSQFRSVTDLKAKSIHFGPSSNCLTDIRFNSHPFYGKLQLPIWFVTNNSKVFFSNLIAFEMSPETDTDFAVISYVNFMKSLLEEPKDVKELREKKILFSCLANDEEVVKMFKEMDTYGMDNIGIFQDVKKRIDEHCDSRGKTWKAKLIYTYFRNPWNAIALLAAIFLLCLTFLQTYYTIHPPIQG